MSDRPIEELNAGDEFRSSLVARADADNHGSPLWYGWALMDAFLAGIDYARSHATIDRASIIEECAKVADRECEDRRTFRAESGSFNSEWADEQEVRADTAALVAKRIRSLSSRPASEEGA